MHGLKFIKVIPLVSLIALLVLGSGQSFAQSPASETYVVQAGSGQGNYRAFAPAAVQVHPGDIQRSRARDRHGMRPFRGVSERARGRVIFE